MRTYVLQFPRGNRVATLLVLAATSLAIVWTADGCSQNIPPQRAPQDFSVQR